jgi:hypothetical protein
MHIEIVLATTLFIISITLLLFYLNPLKESVSPTTIISAIEDSLKEQTYTNLTKIFIKTRTITRWSISCTLIGITS